MAMLHSTIWWMQVSAGATALAQERSTAAAASYPLLTFTQG